MDMCRPGRHPIRGSQDRLPNGGCRECDREAGARYRDKRRAALGLVRTLEAHGIITNPDTLGIEYKPGEANSAPAEVLADSLVDRFGEQVN